MVTKKTKVEAPKEGETETPKAKKGTRVVGTWYNQPIDRVFENPEVRKMLHEYALSLQTLTDVVENESDRVKLVIHMSQIYFEANYTKIAIENLEELLQQGVNPPDNLVNEIYSLTKKFPKEETFCLTAQLRRAVISVPLNIAEGSIKRTKKDFAYFVRISLGSLMETMTCIEISLNQKYITKEECEKIQELVQELYFKLISLDKFLTKNNNSNN